MPGVTIQPGEYLPMHKCTSLYQSNIFRLLFLYYSHILIGLNVFEGLSDQSPSNGDQYYHFKNNKTYEIDVNEKYNDTRIQ